MKKQQPNRAITLSALLAALLLASPPNTNAQLATQQNQQSDSVVAVVADAMGIPFVPHDQRPIFGTYWEVRNTLPCMLAPLPCPPLDQTIPVYAIGDPVLGGQFLVDEMAGQPLAPQAQIYSRRSLNTTDAASIVQAQAAELQDFVAQVQERQANAQLLAAAGLSTMGLDGPNGGGVFGPLDYSYTADDLWLEIICVTNTTGVFTVHPPAAEQTNGVYDLLMTTNLTIVVPGLNLTNWYWVLRTEPGETNLIVPGLWNEQAFFRLARTNDTDGDGLSDAIEHLVTHTDPNVPDPNPFPVIVSQPLSQTVDWGDSVTFTIQATGFLPLNYQWQFTDFSGTTNINGATGASLTLNNVDSTAAGSYSVQVWNLLGSTVSSNAVLTVQSSGENAVLLTGPRQDLRLKGDTTYFVDGSAGPVELYGTTVIEGGAVIKYGTNVGAKLLIKGPVVTQTGPYNPAILTAQDDDLVGWVLNASTGVPTNYYASAALEIASTADSSLKYLRIAYAQTAIQYTGTTNHMVTDTVRHAQILHCGTAFECYGATNTARVLNLANILISDVGQAIGGSYFRGTAQHLTVDACNTFATDQSASALGFHVTNSIFSTVTNLGTGLGLDGANNGFYPDTAPQFGVSPVTDDQPPFAPTGGVDGQGNPFVYIANGQGAYYLRGESPFSSAGSTNADPALKNDFAQMTTFVPPELMFDDISSSQTIGPVAIRDPQAQSLGYHYPVVDYVINGVTVNNATLNIDQGTVLASQGYPFPWGIRLNPGGRLNVNGAPTNRVVFAHLEAVQESPFWDLEPWGPTITWRELYFLSGIPTPYPEAKLLYSDFPTLSGGWNGHLWPINGYLSLSYSIISSLTIDGCHFQGGGLLYDDGGPQGRSFTARNTVLDRCYVGIYDTGGFAEYFDQPECSSAITAANNLFYQCQTILFPVPGDGAGTNWTFTDNVFDNVLFYDSWGVWNGPVGVNHHNAYIDMASIPNGANRLTPPAPSSTDPDIQALRYQTGSLGNFYLPASATSLIAKGSRSAAAAGEYHFTSLTNSQKEASGQVSIGPHYLALVSGGAPDYNGDGIPDFIADRNGNGIETSDETPWQSANTATLSILAPASNSTLTGVIKLRVNPGTNAAAFDALYPLVDGHIPAECLPVTAPATSLAEIQVDTGYLEDGQHTFAVAAYSSAADDGFQIQLSEPVSFATTNSIRQPRWQDRAGLAVNLNLEVPPSATNYTVWFFNSGYPKAQDPFAPGINVSYHQDSPTNGTIAYSETQANLGLGDGSVSPMIYSFTEVAADASAGGPSGGTAANPNTVNEPPFPEEGLWTTAYADNIANYDKFRGTNVLIADLLSPDVNPITLSGNDPWMHGIKLDHGWLESGFLSSAGGSLTLAATPNPYHPDWGQTWPVRMGDGNILHYRNDRLALMQFLSNPDVRNFYGYSHGSPMAFFGWYGEAYKRRVHHRYRYVFLDGCMTTTGIGDVYRALGATDVETIFPVYPPDEVTSNTNLITDMNYYNNVAKVRPGVFMGWKVESFSKHYVDPAATDAITGQSSHWAVYEAMCNWHGQFLFYWALGNDGVVQAVEDANFWAMSDYSDPPVDYSLTTQTVDPNGHLTEILFDPATCLRIFGLADMHFTWFNEDWEWP